MAATIQARIATGASEGSGANAETGVKFSREDTQVGTTPIPKPTAAGTNYSWYKSLFLYVVSGGGSTSILNRKIRHATAPSAGLTLHFKPDIATYVQATSGNKPTDNATTDDATPSTYTLMSTTMQDFDTASAAATDSTRNGDIVQVVLGISSLWSVPGGALNAVALPSLELQFDEQ